MILRCGSFALIAYLLLGATAAALRSEEVVGLSTEKPSQGWCVKTDRGFMVPYRTKIPGTDISFEMVPVPGGKFRMGGEPNALKPDQVNEIEAKVEPFWIGRYEVTWAEYNQYYELGNSFRRFNTFGIRKVTAENQIDAVTTPSVLYDERDYFPAASEKLEWPKHPAVAMTQYAAKQYTKWLSKLTGEFYRLPAEIEWEYACRAGSTARYSFGDDEAKLREYAWFADNSNDDTHPVGLKLPNRWGLFDMHGNAGEWVLDQTSKTYEPLKKAVAAGDPAIDWPTRLYPRTVRGGSWDSNAGDCRSAARVGSSAKWHDDEPLIPVSPTWLCATALHRRVGFRIIRPLNPPPIHSHAKYWDADVDEIKKAVREYLSNGHSTRGVVDPQLPAAILRAKQ